MMLFDELCRRYGAALNGKNRSVLAVRDPFVRGKLGESIYETAGISAKDTVREVEKLLSL